MKALKTIQGKKEVIKTIYGNFIQTVFYKDGVKYCTFPPEIKQPHKNLKTITINCWKWKIEWI